MLAMLGYDHHHPFSTCDTWRDGYHGQANQPTLHMKIKDMVHNKRHGSAAGAAARAAAGAAAGAAASAAAAAVCISSCTY